MLPPGGLTLPAPGGRALASAGNTPASGGGAAMQVGPSAGWLVSQSAQLPAGPIPSDPVLGYATVAPVLSTNRKV